jgi:hypothetical protein
MEHAEFKQRLEQVKPAAKTCGDCQKEVVNRVVVFSKSRWDNWTKTCENCDQKWRILTKKT